MNEKQKQWSVKIPKVYQANYKTSIEGKSRAAAIKAKCLDCCNWERVEVSGCPAETCPLHPYRPYRSPDSPKNPQKTGTLENQTIGG